MLPVVLLAAGCVSVPSMHDGGSSNPSNPKAAVVTSAHSPVLAGYRADQDPPDQSWLQANEAVRRAGGWRAYAREAAKENKP